MTRPAHFSSFAALLLASLLPPAVHAQVDCAAGVFYGAGTDGEVHALTISGGSVVLGDAVLSNSNALAGLGLADLGDGPTFYTAMYPGMIRKAVSGVWETVYTDTLIRANAAGRGPYLYFQNMRIPTPNPAFMNRIDRFDGTTATTIWDDTTGYQVVADMAVDEGGNVYFFTGANAFTASQLNVMTPDGTIISSTPIAFNAGNAYGCFLMGDALYIGFGPSNIIFPDKLVPLRMVNGTATLGTPINMPTPVIGTTPNGQILLQFTDLESCAPTQFSVPTGIAAPAAVAEEEIIHAFGSQVRITVADPAGALIEVHDTAGRLLMRQRASATISWLDLGSRPDGIYIVQVLSGHGSSVRRIVKG